MGKTAKRTAVRLALAALVAVPGLCLAVVAVDSYLDPFDDQPFDPAVWAVADDHERMSMARGAVRRIPPGTPEAEVVAVLGSPGSVQDSHRLTGSAPAGAVRTYSYSLGGSSLSSLRGLDSAFVWVHVGSDGRVIAAEIGGG